MNRLVSVLVVAALGRTLAGVATTDRDQYPTVAHSYSQVQIPGGTFIADPNEEESVSFIMTAFEMGATEVTLSLYETVMGQTPEEVSSENLPVGNVSWYEAVEFCNKLSYLEELEPAYRIEGDSVVWDLSSDGYRLPTEAEWVYAASLGSDTAYSGSDNIEKVAWYLDNTNGRKRGVALLLPNASGLYDMSGNMWEWCWDGYSESPFTSRSGPVNAPADRYRVARGGSFENSGHKACKVSHRNRFDAGVRYIDVGFRVVRVKE